MAQAIANHDFATARSCSEEERVERNKLRSLYERHGLSGWVFDIAVADFRAPPVSASLRLH